jgi:hypothetical protein
MPAVPRQTSQAPQRQRTRVYPTPKIADVIIRQSFETTRTAIPAYGTAHPDATQYPNHKLVYVRVADEQGLYFEFLYAANRSNQEDYNYEITYPYGGEIKYPRITRKYVLPRGDNALALGSADPGTTLTGLYEYKQPGGQFGYKQPGGVFTYEFQAITQATLVAQSERPLGDELNGLYVEVTRVYDVIPGSEDPTTSDGFGQVDNGYTVERPIQDKNWVRLTWTLELPRTVADTYRKDNFDQCPISGYSNLYLVNEQIKSADDQNQTSKLVRIYEGNIAGDPVISQNSVKGRAREFPGKMPPEKFLSFVETRTDANRVITPDDISLEAVTAPSGMQLLGSKVAPDGTNSGERSVTATRYDIGTVSGKRWDDNLRDYVPYTVSVVSADDGINYVETPGEQIEVQPINRYWSIVTRETPRETAAPGLVKEYETSRPFVWPAVLPSGGPGALRWDGLNRRMPKGSDTFINELFYQFTLRRAWSGSCRTKIRVWWQKSPPIVNPIEAMQPTEIRVSWPIGTIVVPPCLHGRYDFNGTTGDNNPDYGPANFQMVVDATNYTDWPESLLISSENEPYKGGFRCTEVIVYSPPEYIPT